MNRDEQIREVKSATLLRFNQVWQRNFSKNRDAIQRNPGVIKLKNKFRDINLEYFQSNHEGELIEKIQEIGFAYDGIIINGGGFTHTSIALRDAIASVSTPAIEVHISNILSREDFRKKSYLSDVCEGIISGLGLMGYEYAINYFNSK